MTSHPFNEGTKLAQIFTILSDGEWHCGKHELPGTQPAKAIQVIRQHGFEIQNKTFFCEHCKDKTVHRRLMSTLPQSTSFIRQQFSPKFRKRILDIYQSKEAITQRKMADTQLEIDHRFPQIRWNADEVLDENMSDDEIKKRYQLLTREHNLWKSRYCENCIKTGYRGTFIGINFFYAGNAKWDTSVAQDDPKGCYGCFWYDPDEWRTRLNELLADQKEFD